MKWIDRLAELWDRRRMLCWTIALAVLAISMFAQRWLPDGFGAEVFQSTSAIPIVGPVNWNARLRFVAQEKEQYLGTVPDKADEGELYTPDHGYHASFHGGHARLLYRIFGGHEGMVDTGTSPILAIAVQQDQEFATGAE